MIGHFQAERGKTKGVETECFQALCSVAPLYKYAKIPLRPCCAEYPLYVSAER